MANHQAVRKIILRGNEAFSDEQLRQGMRTEVGKVYDEELLKEDFQRIVDFYKKHGYSFARIDEKRLFRRRFPDGVYLHIYIDEGRIGRLTVEGNSRTRDHVILRELLIKTGDVYTVEDELESERILRRKPFLGDAEIGATWDAETSTVEVHVVVTDLWSLIPALDIPAFSKDSSDFLVQVVDSNMFGTGNQAQFRYQRISEAGERTRSLIRTRYTDPRLFSSHLEFDGHYTQKREGDSWQVSLKRPQYTLKTRWSAAFLASEHVDLKRWYENGKKTETFDRSLYRGTGQITRYFGTRHRQVQLSVWGFSERSRFELLESHSSPNLGATWGATKRRESQFSPRDRDIKILGISIGRRDIDFVRTRYVNQMGRVEDIAVGYGYSMSMGYGSPFYGSDRSETVLNWLFSSSLAHQDSLFLNIHADYTIQFSNRNRDSVFKGRVKSVRKDLFYQTLAVQLSSVFEFGREEESQVILDGEHGMRGYSPYAFSGEKMIILNIESRSIFNGGIFERLKSLVAVGSVIFLDLGYIWSGNEFVFNEPKRSVGAGLRFSIPRLSGSRVFRFDLAYPLDMRGGTSRVPVITYGIGHVF
ncbi:MAG: hypothetical protein OXN17_20720 [Candidatus Poribacteria bacterium]|nr:hypothetical protein [Candidatus Poribacteria bacterium]